MYERVRIGIAGAGVFGAHHASKYACHERAVVAAVYDIDPERAHALAERYGAHAVSDFDDLLDHIDALIVAAPASRHFEPAERALRADRHVFVEKPLALSVSECNALINLAEARRRILQVGHQERYVFDAVGLLERDCPPLEIDCVRKGPSSGRCEDVSVVFDLMIHDIDLVRQLTNADIQSVSAEGDAGDMSAALVLSNGAKASMTASRRAASRERRMSLVYEDGVVEFDFVNRTLQNTTPARLDAGFDGAHSSLALSDPLGYGANAFIHSILHDAAPLASGPDGRDAVAWATRIEEAAGLSATTAAALERMRA
ncbi:MAG: Gfo/Idh/MocA family protein [Hyphococcus sp.]